MTTARTPLLEVSKVLRIRWYRCPIDREKLMELMRRNDLRGAFQAGGHLTLWIATGLLTYTLYRQQLWIGFAVALFLHGTVGAFFRGLAVHELGHGTVFKQKWLNRLFLRIFSVLAWWNYHEYAMSHTYHHRYTLHPEGDREVVLPRNPTKRFLSYLQLFTVNITFATEANAIIPTIKDTLWTAIGRYDRDREWMQALYEGQPEAHRQAVNWARLLLLFHIVAIGVFIAIGEPILAVIISGHCFIASWLKHFVGLPMHCGLRDNVPDFRLCVRTIRLDPISEFLYWHMNWHTEHHMFAAVPCYNLPKLHEQVKDDMPEPRSLTGAWREMLATWRRQQDDPGYQFDTPLPSTAHPAVTEATTMKETHETDPLASSIGDIAPKSLS